MSRGALWRRVCLMVLLSGVWLLGAFGETRDAFRPYLGQKAPGVHPEVFAPGVVNTGLATRDMALSPDGRDVYFVVMVGRFQRAAIVGAHWEGDGWSEVEVFSGLDDSRYRYLEPHISPDGGHFFFVTDHPLPEDKSEKPGDMNIWVMTREGAGWSGAVPVGYPVNTDGDEFFPCTSRDGTLYFTAPAREEAGECIYMSRRTSAGYAPPERMPPQINAGKARYNAWFSPDGDLAIVPIFALGESRGVDYYAVHRKNDGTWADPISLGPLVNTDGNEEHSACISPDGRYLFFMSSRMPEKQPPHMTLAWLKSMREHVPNGLPSIWWVSTEGLTALGPAS